MEIVPEIYHTKNYHVIMTKKDAFMKKAASKSLSNFHPQKQITSFSY